MTRATTSGGSSAEAWSFDSTAATAQTIAVALAGAGRTRPGPSRPSPSSLQKRYGPRGCRCARSRRASRWWRRWRPRRSWPRPSMRVHNRIVFHTIREGHRRGDEPRAHLDARHVERLDELRPEVFAAHADAKSRERHPGQRQDRAGSAGGRIRVEVPRPVRFDDGPEAARPGGEIVSTAHVLVLGRPQVKPTAIASANLRAPHAPRAPAGAALSTPRGRAQPRAASASGPRRRRPRRGTSSTSRARFPRGPAAPRRAG